MRVGMLHLLIFFPHLITS